MLLAHTALICSTALSFGQVHFKHEQPQVLSPDSHVTLGTIQQTQDATCLHWVYRHTNRHAATVVLKFMETHWRTLDLLEALSKRNLVGWIK